jgi:hypothetical protein
MRREPVRPFDSLKPFLPLGLSLVVLSCRPGEVPQVAPDPTGLKGIQSGWVLDDAPGGDSTYQVAFDRYPTILPTIVGLGARWYRFEFRVTAKAVERARRRREARGLPQDCRAQCSAEDLGWDAHLVAAYGRALDSLTARGIKVLGLISNATVEASQAEQVANSAEAAGGNGDNAYIANLGSVVFPMLLRRFADRIRVWEISNEPNVWTSNDAYTLTASDADTGRLPGGTFVYPSNFAQLLSRSFYAARAAEQDGAPALATVSGGLLSMNRANDGPTNPLRDAALFDNVAGDYLQAFVDAGFAHAGWQTIVKRYHRFPVDGWGLHLYVNQETAAVAGDPWANFGRYVAAFQHMTGQLSAKHLGRGRTLPVWITELGFGTPLARIPAAERSESLRARYWAYQAEGLDLAYQCVTQLETGAPTFWFALFDVPNAEIESGLFTPVWGTPGFGPLTAKPAADRYRSAGAAAGALDCRRAMRGGRLRRVRCNVGRQPAGSPPGAQFTGECRDA